MLMTSLPQSLTVPKIIEFQCIEDPALKSQIYIFNEIHITVNGYPLHFVYWVYWVKGFNFYLNCLQEFEDVN